MVTKKHKELQDAAIKIGEHIDKDKYFYILALMDKGDYDEIDFELEPITLMENITAQYNNPRKFLYFLESITKKVKEQIEIKENKKLNLILDHAFDFPDEDTPVD